MPGGRPPKPTHLHLLDGTFRADRHAEAAANAAVLEPVARMPRPPAFLGDVGRREWNRVGPELIANRILTRADMAAFAGYCASLDRAITAERALHLSGLTMFCKQGEISRPEVAIARTAWAEVRKFGQEFGITPSSRTRVRAVPPPPEAKPQDPWDEVLNG